MRVVRWSIAACLALPTVSACRSATPPFARLESAVVGDQYAGSPTRTHVRVVRGDSVVAPSVAMRLFKGDSIITSATTRVVVTFEAGYEVTLDTNTAIFIENPSVFLRIGQAFIRKLLGQRPASDTTKLDVHTPQATLHDAGTEYLVSVNRGATDVSVLTGAVEAASRVSAWRARYSALERGRIDSTRGQRMPPLSREALEAELRWVRRVDRLTKIAVPRLDSMTEAQARAALERVGLRVLFVLQRETSDFAPGLVIEQSPVAGANAAPGTYVTLTVAKEPPSSQCTVPNIIEKKEAEAKRLLEAARLRGEVTQRIGEIDVVTSQSARAGSRVRCGSVVQYTWGRVG